MTYLTPKFPTPFQLLFPAAIGLCLFAAQPARACSPAPGSRPAPLEERVSTTPYVFAGTVTQVNGEILTLRVDRYFKGKGPRVLRLSGFNQHSCHDFISQPGGRYLFFAERGEGGIWNAVYDGAFGSVESWSEEVEAELRNLGRNPSPSSFPRSVANAVKSAAARETGDSPARIEILQAEPRTWSDNCLGLPFPNRGCLRTTVEGWLVTVRAGGQQLVYRTDARGSLVYRDRADNSASLPQSLAEAVKREAAQTFRISGDRLQIASAVPQTWPDGCLGLQFRDRACTQALVEGWRVELHLGNPNIINRDARGNGVIVQLREPKQRFIYRTDARGNAIYLENGAQVLPVNVREAVLAAATRKTQRSRNQLRIAQAFPRVWDGCLGVYEEPRQPCTKIAIFGWQVVVEGSNNRLLVYHTDGNGSDVRFNANASRLNSGSVTELPAAVEKAVLNAAARQTGLPTARLQVTGARRRTWNGCLGIDRDRRACPEIGILGWQVMVEGENNRLVYHADGSGSDVRFNASQSRLEGDRATIALPQGAIFQSISSGGIAGETTTITLWRDGKVTVRSRRMGSNQPQTRWVSRQQVRRFQRLLRQQRFERYDGLDFPPPVGSADIIGMTLVSRQGTTQVADYDREKLPQPLQVVLASWWELVDSMQARPISEQIYWRNRAIRLNSLSN